MPCPKGEILSPIKKPVSICCLSLCLFIFCCNPSASFAADEYVAGININGQDSSLAQSSGTLPGTSPSVHEPLLRTKDGRPIPLWYDGVFPPLDPTLVEQTKKLLEDKKKNAADFEKYLKSGSGFAFLKKHFL